MASRKKRLTKVEAAYYRKHPKPAVSPVKQLMLRAKGVRRGKKSRPGDKVIAHLHSYSLARGKVREGMLKLFVGLGLVGDSGTITAKGERLLASYRRRKISNPSLVMRRGRNKGWLAGRK